MPNFVSSLRSLFATKLHNLLQRESKGFRGSSLVISGLRSPVALSLGMDVRRDRFGFQLVKFLQDVSESHFIAFDLEFSGLGSRNRDRASKPNLEEYYGDLREAVQQFQVLQIGLTLVKLDEQEGQYIVKPYNYNISPLPDLRERQFQRTWSMNSGAISFLQRQGFDFGRWITHGVPYLSRQEEHIARENMQAEAKRQDMTLKEEDQPLIQHIRHAIEEWQSQPKEEQEEYLNIPHDSPPGLPQELNRYQMRLTHQIVQNEYPGLSTRGMTGFVQITNPSSEQQANMKELEAEQREKDLNRAVGFRWIMEGIAGKDVTNMPEEYLIPLLPRESNPSNDTVSARKFVKNLAIKLQQRRRIIVGHNCLTDLMYLYKMTIGDLPEDVQLFKEKVHELFPAVIDTKYLASSHSERYGRSPLGDVEMDLRADKVPEMYTPPDFDRYVYDNYYHEAGFDSYITAIVAMKLSTKLYKEGSARKKDRDNGEQKIATVASSSPPEFGMEEGYITAAESIPKAQTTEQTDRNTSNINSATEENQINTNISSNLSSKPEEPSNQGALLTDNTPEVIAVKQHKHATSPLSSISNTTTSTIPTANSDTTTTNNKADTPMDKMKSAFASTSIWDTLSSTPEMPGEQQAVHNDRQKEEAEPEEGSSWSLWTGRKKNKNQEAKSMDEMVKAGQMMPRWSEERVFWERYGNRLQVNGTQEGVLRLGV